MTEKTPADPGITTAPSPAARPSLVRAKDHASMAVVLAAASVAWFGWGHQGALFEGWLKSGMAVSALALIAGLLIVRRIPARPTLATDPRARKVYWVAVIAEVVLILLGMFVLAQTGLPMYASTWTLFVVGVHFLPFVGPFNAPTLRLTAVACVLVSTLALWAGLTGWAPAPTIAGAGGGIVLLGFAILLMLTANRDRTAATSHALN